MAQIARNSAAATRGRAEGATIKAMRVLALMEVMLSDTDEDPKMRAKKLERREPQTRSEQSICIGSIGVVSLALRTGQY